MKGNPIELTGRLAGRVAIITGASRGIGEAIARAYVAEGARVVVASRKQESVDAVAASLPEGSALAVACHTGDLDACERLVAACVERFGTPDVLVNNAATNPYFGPMIHTGSAAWAKTFEVNLEGAFTLIRHVAERLVAEGKPGSIINISSINGIRSAPFSGVYGMTKAALISMTQTLASELGGGAIRVNAIAPGLIDTKLASAMVENPQILGRYTERAALGRIGRPEEIAGPAVFLASDASTYITGHTLVVDGGYTSV